MPVIYVYQASDFTTGLPDEDSAGGATGSVPRTLTLKPTAVPIAVTINDADGYFEEIDATQNLVDPVTLNGVTYPAGNSILGAYTLENSTSGLQVSAFHVGTGINVLSNVGPVMGLMSTQPLVPGQSYSFDMQSSTYTSPVPYTEFVACFTKGTPVDTFTGPRPIESLKAGDLVMTRDNGAQPLRWIGSRTVSATGNFAPVVFAKGALGNHRELAVSPQHRMLLQGWQCEMLFGTSEALTPAIQLTNGDTIRRREGGLVTYYHLLFDRHEIVTTLGTASESFHPSEVALTGFDMATRAEVLTLFPGLDAKASQFGPMARKVLKTHETHAYAAY